MLNKVILIGRLTTDIELRRTNDNIPYAYFTLAVNRPGKSDNTDFVSCVAWRSTAELMNNYLNKGSLIAIEGRLEVFRSEKNGNYETRTNVNVQSVQFLEARKTQENVNNEAKVESQKPSSTTGVTFANNEQTNVEEQKKTEETSNDQVKIDFDEIIF